MWLLGRLLPIMVGDKVPDSDEYWVHYMDLLSITDLLLAPALLEDDVANLVTLIHDYLHEFKRLYTSSSITPKLHYLVHMGRLILE